MVLTPHLTAPLDDDRHPSDLSILQSGTYNLGFLALRALRRQPRCCDWWQRKLARDCVVDIPRGLFTDQKWMDLVPGPLRAHPRRAPPGLERGLLEPDAPRRRGRRRRLHRQRPAAVLLPLLGLRPAQRLDQQAPGPLHAGRLRAGRCRSCSRATTAQLAAAPGASASPRLPYAFATLADGTRAARLRAARSIRSHLDWHAAAARPAHRRRRALPDRLPDRAGRCRAAADVAPGAAAVPGSGRPAGGLPRHAGHAGARPIWPGLPSAPGPRPASRARWRSAQPCLQPAPPRRTRPSPPRPARSAPARTGQRAARRIARTARARRAPALGARRGPPPTVRRSLPYRLAYRLAWRARHVLRPMTTLPFRQRMREALLKRAFPARQPPSRRGAPPGTASGRPARPDRRHGDRLRAGRKRRRRIGARHLARPGPQRRARTRCWTSGSATSRAWARPSTQRWPPAASTPSACSTSTPTSCRWRAPSSARARSRAPTASATGPGSWRTFPTEWHGAFAHVDEVWVPSTFCQRAIAAASPVPVLVMPHAVEVPGAAGARPRALRPARPTAVVFLAMADMMSIAGRKNPFAAVEAFAAAFAGTDRRRARLVVKIANAERDAGPSRACSALAASCRGIHLLTKSLDRPALNALHRQRRLLRVAAPRRGLRPGHRRGHGARQGGDGHRLVGQHGLHDRQQLAAGGLPAGHAGGRCRPLRARRALGRAAASTTPWPSCAWWLATPRCASGWASGRARTAPANSRQRWWARPSRRV